MSTEDDLQAAWMLHRPHPDGRLCLGPLRFGMTREEVMIVAPSYGPVERVEDHAARMAGMAASTAELATFGISAEDIAAARAAWEAAALASVGAVTEDRGLGAPSLDYAGGRLSRVATDYHCERLILQGRPVYAGDALALLAALEAMDGGGARRQGDTVWFPRLGVTAMGFYGDREDGTVGLLDDPDDPRIRHLVLEDYEPVSDGPADLPVTFHGR